MNGYAFWLIAGIIIFAAGWAVRSTYIMQSYVNKPIGGALVTMGFVIMGVSIWKIIKNR